VSTRKPAYQADPFHLGEGIWDRRELTPLELFKIIAWKSAKGLASATTVKTGEIERVTREAIESLSEYREAQAPPLSTKFWVDTYAAIGLQNSGLRSLPGVQMPVASAILCVLNPRVWPVVDRWAMGALFDDGPRDRTTRFDCYRVYVHRLNEIRGDRTIHEADIVAMNVGMGVLAPTFEQVSLEERRRSLKPLPSPA
jgi:hypothetical protein